MSKEDDELKEIWSLFSSEDSSVNEKRKQIHSQYQNQTLSSFPDHLSITTAFDEVLQCFSLGGQVKHYYRYGSYSLCQSQREKFWFSVTNGTFSQDKKAPDFTQADMERRQKIQEYYKKKLLEQKAAGSSEDVWDARTELLDRPFEENRG
ncbi:hypothetical protein CLIB1423_05S01596 [[Candida] railenensis]|uniref:Early meiotic induction protein 1 n=1 Tax=[Candida] railenensis TaxID=45579 RepID=A0A9P0QNF2_9ASCO|nr:hypothetical protein CLIB1423_05S01596 [[Candida] railenensis]